MKLMGCAFGLVLLGCAAFAAQADAGHYVTDIYGSPALAAPFYAQDLAVAKADAQMNTYVAQAMAQFQAKQGRSPESELERAAATADWVSNNLRHPSFWPENPWAPRLYTGPAYNYDALYSDPLKIIQAALAVDPADGANYHWALCTHQNFALAGLLNAQGLHARVVSVAGHDGLEYFSFQFHKWVWMDATFNEHFVLRNTSTGVETPLGAAELNAMTLNGTLTQVLTVKHGVPSASFPGGSYLQVQPHGFRQYAVHNFMSIYNGNGLNATRADTVVYVPPIPPSYQPIPGEVVLLSDPNNCADFSSPSCTFGAAWTLWPQTDSSDILNPRLDDFYAAVQTHEGEPESPATQDRYAQIKMRSALPYTQYFQARNDSDTTWTNVATVSVPSTLPQTVVMAFYYSAWGVGSAKVHLRAMDTFGNVTKEVYFVPRFSVN